MEGELHRIDASLQGLNFHPDGSQVILSSQAYPPRTLEPPLESHGSRPRRPVIAMRTIVAGLLVGALCGAADRVPLGLDLFMPVPEQNPLTPEKIALGRRLFFDRRLSADQSISCSTCHDPARGYADNRPVSAGVLGRKGRRNAPALINRGYGRSFFWDGRIDSLEEQVLKPIENADEMNLPLRLPHGSGFPQTRSHGLSPALSGRSSRATRALTVS